MITEGHAPQHPAAPVDASGVDPVLRLGMHAPGGEVGTDFHSIATGYRPPAGMG